MNWGRLNAALEFYQRRGYAYAEVPWVVSAAASDVTKPEGGNNLIVNTTCGDPAWGVLVASAEQSFIEMMYQGTLSPGKYVALTPCWRREPEYNKAVRPWFMKVELIHFGTTEPEALLDVIDDAERFMDNHSMRGTARVPTYEGTDLYLNGYEVGSYGVRTLQDFKWVYGTGLAEPRFQVALNAAP